MAQLSEEQVAALTQEYNEGDAVGYYSLLAEYGVPYGLLAAATSAGSENNQGMPYEFYGDLANAWVESVAEENGVLWDEASSNKLMNNLFQADYNARESNDWNDLSAKDIAD